MMLRNLLLVAALATAPVARATTVTPLTTAQMAEKADLVVRGTVSQIWPEISPSGRSVVTKVRIDVTQVLKGESDDVVVVQVPGGTYGGAITLVEGMPRYDEGEEVVVFLARHASGALSTLGAVQGKLTVRFDARARAEIVQRVMVSPRLDYDHRLAPFPEPADRVLWTDLEDEILLSLQPEVK